MKLCKCGKPIYDEPGQRSDKCYLCWVKEFKGTKKNLFIGGRFYEKKENPVGYVEDF